MSWFAETDGPEMFDRNDAIFGEVAGRFGVSEGVVENLILGMLWAGERALGRDEVGSYVFNFELFELTTRPKQHPRTLVFVVDG